MSLKSLATIIYVLQIVTMLNFSLFGWLNKLNAHGYVNSVDWNGGVERWIGLLEWSTGLDYWSATPTNAQFGSSSMATLNLIFKLYKAGRS